MPFFVAHGSVTFSCSVFPKSSYIAVQLHGMAFVKQTQNDGRNRNEADRKEQNSDPTMVPRGLLHSDGWKLKIADIPIAKQVCEVRMGLKKGTCFFSPKTTLKNGKAFYMPQVNIFSSAPYVVPFLVRNRARKDVAKICKAYGSVAWDFTVPRP